MTEASPFTPLALTPQEILAKLDEYVVGQQKAKRAVAVALRNRWRRRQLARELSAVVYQKHILLIGPTGVGKTEIARRLAALARAPFVKVEATKYSEVGYHGRDVESMVRDLVENSVAMVRREHAEAVAAKAQARANERILDALMANRGIVDPERVRSMLESGRIWRPPSMAEFEKQLTETEEQRSTREELKRAFAAGELDTSLVEIELIDRRTPTLNIMGPQGNDAMGIDARALQEVWGRAPQQKTKQRRLTVAEARKLAEDEEADKLLDEDRIHAEAVDRAENDGIIFVDEVDKIVGAGGGDGPDVSREGVQRDLLSIVEGCDVYTRYGHVRTDHILFIAAGAFHFHKPSELIPELQGRFPVRVALKPLTEADFVRILTEPRNSLARQYQSLLATENVALEFARSGLERIAHLAFRQNTQLQDIGARRLFTVLELLLEEISFRASELGGKRVVVDAEFVTKTLGDSADDPDLIKYQL
ncbi:MAG: ATP-dependent protease ATPase subunit HslU [Planctomycetes bacterium]|nr:ATP-dependent protease ATPase subunit HslU [Planctomycetota bacterium]